MISIIKKSETHEIISCNIHQEGSLYQLWVTRPNGKNMKIAENQDFNEVSIIKEAIDYAVKEGLHAIELD